MKQREYIGKLLTSTSDPVMVAEAYRDYYKRMYERALNNASFLDNDDYEDRQVILPSLNLVDGTKRYVSCMLSDLKTAINNNFDSEDDTQIIKVQDLFTDSETTISLDDVSSTLASDCDNNYLTWKAFEAVLDGDKASENFQAGIQLEAPNRSRSVTDSVVQIWDVLRGPGSITEKIDSVKSFSGLSWLSSFQEGQSLDPMEAIDLGQYTGANPIVSFFNNIKWPESGFIGKIVGSIAAGVATLAKFLIVDVTTAIGKGIIKLFKGIFGFIQRTTVDPVDYKVNGDKIGHFDIPGKFAYAIDYDYENTARPSLPNAYLAAKRLLIEGSTPKVCFSIGPVFYRVFATYGETSTSLATSDHPTIWLGVERYVRPTDPVLLTNLLSKYNFNFSQGQTAQQITYGQLLDLFNELTNTDLRMDAKSEEKEVIKGIATSYQLSTALGNFALANVVGGMTIDPIPTEDSEYDLSYDELYGIPIDIGRAAWSDLMQNLYYLKLTTASYATGNASMSFKRGAVHGQSSIPVTVTNRTFIEWLTCAGLMNDDDWYNPQMTSEKVTAFSPSGFYTSLPGYIRTTLSGYVPFWGPHIYSDNERPSHCMDCIGFILFYCLNHYDQAQTTYPDTADAKGLYLAYSRVADAPSDINASVKTDSENAEAIKNFLTGTIILAAAAVIGIGAAVYVKKGAKALVLAQQKLMGTEYALQTALNSPDATPERINALYKQVIKGRRKTKFLDKMFGSAKQSTPDYTSDLASITSISTKTNDLISG